MSRKPRKPWTDSDTEKMCELQAQNWTDGWIAKVLDVARITVWCRRVALGLDRVMVAGLRVVSLDWKNGSSTEHIVIAEQLYAFVEACKRLHVNPVSIRTTAGETASMWRLRVAELSAHGPYWWAEPQLGVTPSDGAFTTRAGISRTVRRDEDHEVDQ